MCCGVSTRNRSQLHAWMLLAVTFASWGCQEEGGNRALPAANMARATVPLRIAAASDLQVALPALVELFRAKSGVEVTLSFDASGRLAEQIRNGAPFDLYMAANASFVEGLVKDGLIDRESVQAYARGTLVLAVSQAMGDQVRTLSDLAKPEIKKIALANPAFAPYGKAGRQALERAHLWTSLEPKIVQADSVKQALVFAQRGDAEAALVGRALANVPEVRSVAIDPELYDPIVQVLAIVKSTGRMDEARAFARLILAEDGQEVLRRFGFISVERTVAAEP